MEPLVHWCSRHNPTPWVRLSQRWSKPWSDQASLSKPECFTSIPIYWYIHIYIHIHINANININITISLIVRSFDPFLFINIHIHIASILINMPISKSVTIPINQHFYQFQYLILASDNDKSPRLIAFPVQGEIDHFLRHLQSKQISPLEIFTQFKNLSLS